MIKTVDPKNAFTPKYQGSSGDREKGLANLTLAVPFVKSFQKLEPLFEGLKVLHDKHVALLNIGLENIEYTTDKTMYVNLEDAVSYDDLYKWTEDSLSYFASNRMNTPPDLLFATFFNEFYKFKLKTQDSDSFTILDFIDSNATDNAYQKIFNMNIYASDAPNVFKEIVKRRSQLTMLLPQERMKECLTFFQMNPFGKRLISSDLLITPQMHTDFLEVFLKEYAGKISVYGLGITLLQLVNQDFEHQIDADIKKHEAFQDIMNLVAGMVSPNPLLRMTPHQALEGYKKLKKRMETGTSRRQE